jgi:hypothetical protein
VVHVVVTDGGDLRECLDHLHRAAYPDRQGLESTCIHSVSENIFRQDTIARLGFNGERKFKDDSDMFYLKF